MHLLKHNNNNIVKEFVNDTKKSGYTWKKGVIFPAIGANTSPRV